MPITIPLTRIDDPSDTTPMVPDVVTIPPATPPPAVVAQTTTETKPPLGVAAEGTTTTVGDIDSQKLPSFIGELKVKFPVTEQEWTFLPVETLRGKTENRWSYPSPIPNVHTEGSSNSDGVLKIYRNLIGDEGVIDLIEESLSKDCQNKWKQAVDTATNPADIPAIFASIFYEGRQREAITADGLSKKATVFMKEFQKEKQANGGVITPKALEYMRLFKEFNSKAQAQLMKDMESLGA